jgi:ribonuclease R
MELAAVGVQIDPREKNDLNRISREAHRNGNGYIVDLVILRNMKRAVYAPYRADHFGLGFTHYTHFTSPIRRYPDLMVHRLLDEYLKGGKSVGQDEYEKKCEYASDMERKAVEAERASVKYKQAEYMMDKIGQEFYGLISGVSKWGIYVELIESKCEGMVRLRDLADDYYFLDEDNYQVTGQRSGYQYKLGDKVKIRVKKIDLSRKELDFQIINDKPLRAPSTPFRPPSKKRR